MRLPSRIWSLLVALSPTALPAQADPAALLAAVQDWYAARTDAATSEGKYTALRDRITEPAPRLAEVIERLNRPLREFAQPTRPTLDADTVEAVLQAVAEGRAAGAAPQRVLPFLVLLHEKAGVDDARLHFALFEALACEPVFAPEAAQRAAAAFGKAAQDLVAAAVASGQPDPRKRFAAWLPLLDTFESPVKGLDWLREQVAAIAAELPGRAMPRGDLAARRLATLESDYAEAVRAGANAKVQRALQAMTRLQPDDAAAWLLLAMARASWGGGGNADAALTSWQQANDARTAARLAHLGFGIVAKGQQPAAIRAAIAADGRKQTWFADQGTVDAARRRIQGEIDSGKRKIERLEKDIETKRAAIARVRNSRATAEYKRNEISGLEAGIQSANRQIDKLKAEGQKQQNDLAQIGDLATGYPSFALQ